MDSTDLSELLGNAPVQSPAFSPMVTGGGDPFIAPVNTTPQKAAPDYSQQFSIMRGSVRNLFWYLAFFLSAMILSMSTPRTMLLQYIPNTYTTGGVVSYMGAAVLGAASVVGAFVINTLFRALI